jgi:hypothetical protein
MKIIFSDHAQMQMKQRDIKEEWIFLAIQCPDIKTEDSFRINIIYFYKKIPNANHKILQVVTKKINSIDEFLIVTCYFNKKMRGKL